MRAPEFWDAPPGLAAGLLTPLGAVWNGAGALRRAVIRSYRAPVPVLCVGNLVAGGLGKDAGRPFARSNSLPEAASRCMS